LDAPPSNGICHTCQRVRHCIQVWQMYRHRIPDRPAVHNDCQVIFRQDADNPCAILAPPTPPAKAVIFI
jgi:hypothetical protein